MKVSDNLQISIRDFRAIKQASISLNGITVLAGVNGSGKSTISRLVYVLLTRMKEYNDLVIKDLSSSLRRYFNVMENIVISISQDYDIYKKYSAFLQLLSEDDLNDMDNRINSICNYISKELDVIILEGQNDVDRYRRMITTTIDAPDSFSFDEALQRIKEMIHSQVILAQEQIKKRPASILNDYLERSFGEKINKKAAITEYGNIIFSDDRSSVPIPHFVDRLFYIDTPFELDNNYYSYWVDLNRALRKTSDQTQSSIASIIEQRIVKGSARYEKSDSGSGFFFKDHNGNDFDLALAATGIRSFSILQMLLRSGNVNENTLLIIDEPEAHLHPQWIVEYARIIILIHKTIGAKFLISSHNPDMVSAIKYIAEAEDCTDMLEYYTAKRAQDGSGRFVFKSTGLDIDPIFKSFNKSFERLNKYARDYDKES